MAMRDAWIEKRAAAMNGGGRNFSQMHFARQGVVTELVRSEIARGRGIIHHR